MPAARASAEAYMGVGSRVAAHRTRLPSASALDATWATRRRDTSFITVNPAIAATAASSVARRTGDPMTTTSSTSPAKRLGLGRLHDVVTRADERVGELREESRIRRQIATHLLDVGCGSCGRHR